MCDQPATWRDQKISFHPLEHLEFYNFMGTDEETDFIYFMCVHSSALKTLSITFSKHTDPSDCWSRRCPAPSLNAGNVTTVTAARLQMNTRKSRVCCCQNDAAFLDPFTCYLYGYKLRSRNMPPHISCATLRTVCNAVLVRHAPRAAARTMAQPN